MDQIPLAGGSVRGGGTGCGGGSSGSGETKGSGRDSRSRVRSGHSSLRKGEGVLRGNFSSSVLCQDFLRDGVTKGQRLSSERSTILKGSLENRSASRNDLVIAFFVRLTANSLTKVPVL